MWKAFTVLLLLCAAAGGAFIVFKDKPLPWRQVNTKQATEWEPEAIAKDPVGYLDAARSQIAEAVKELKARKEELDRQKADAESRATQSAEEKKRIVAMFDIFRDEYRKAVAQSAWPVEIDGKAYQEDNLKNEIVQLSNRLDTLESEIQQYGRIQTAASNHLANLERRLSEAEARRAEIVRQSENARAQETLKGLDMLQTDLDAIAGVVDSVDSSLSAPGVDRLIEQQQARTGHDEFRNVLLRDTGDGLQGNARDLSEGPFFDPEGKPLVWYHLGESGEYELFARPGSHPVLGVPLEPMTPDASKAYQVWRTEQADLKKQAEAQAVKRAEEEQARKESALAARESASFRNRYLNTAVIPESGAVTLVGVAGNASASLLRAAAAGSEKVYKGRDGQVATNAFTGTFCTASVFSDLASGNKTLLARLGLPQNVKRIVLVKVEYGSPRPTGTHDLTTVDGSMVVSILDREGNLLANRDYSVPGAGLDDEGAKRAVSDRLSELVLADAASLP